MCQLPETSLQLSVGAKLLPTLPMKGRNFLHYLAMALGLESRREGFLNPYSWKHNKMVWGMNCEAYTGTDLDNSGLATRPQRSAGCAGNAAGMALGTKLGPLERSIPGLPIGTNFVKVRCLWTKL